MTEPSNDELFAQWHGLGDAGLATILAEEAGRRLVEHRRVLVERGTTQWQLRDSADMLAHHFLLDALGAVRPDDAVLSEEGADDRRRMAADRVWIVDPLDGTNEYGEGRADWAVHVALWERGTLTAGAVSLPALGTVFECGDAFVTVAAVERATGGRSTAANLALLEANAGLAARIAVALSTAA